MMDQLTKTPTQPTVFILVDLSGSEFDECHDRRLLLRCGPAVEQVVKSCRDHWCGFGVFAGDRRKSRQWLLPAPERPVAPALNHYTAIHTAL